MNTITRKDLKLPKVVLLQNTSDFTKFEEVLRTLCEKFLSHDWDWTFRVGGKVQREIEMSDPENVGLKIIQQSRNNNNNNYNNNERDPFHERNENFFYTPQTNRYTTKTEIKTETRGRAPPPPPPRNHVSKGVANAMGKRGWEIDRLRQTEDERFFNIHRNEFESKELLGIRKEIWEWVVMCVEGEEKNLFCTHLVREVDKWDIHLLFRNVRDFLHTENYKEYGTRLEKYFTAQPKAGEDIFTYISRIDKYREEIEHLQHLAQDAGETLAMPKFYRVWKILSAVEKYPEYRVFTDKVQQMTPQEWVKLNPETVRQELHKIHSNKTQLQTTNNEREVALVMRVPPPPPQSVVQRGGREGRGHTVTHNTQHKTRTPTPSKYPVSEQLKHFNCPEGECLGHFRYGKCPRAQRGRPCSFLHTQTVVDNSESKSFGRSRSISPVVPTRTHSHSHSPNTNHPRTYSQSPTHSPSQSRQGGIQSEGVCEKCGHVHSGMCYWSKRCFVCGGLHAAKVCRKNQTTVSFGSQGRERRNSVRGALCGVVH